VGICVAGVVAQQYFVASEDDVDYADFFEGPEQQQGGERGQVVDYVYGPPGYDGPISSGSSEEAVYLAPSYPVPGPSYWAGEDRLRDGWGKEKKKKKKKKGKKKKKKKCKKGKKGKKGKKKGNCGDEGGWGPVSVSTDGVKVGWKGHIPPVKGAGW
jgi:hypothetical protein